MMDRIIAMISELLTRLIDVQSRSARIETRLMKLAEGLDINVKGKEDWK